MKDYNLLRKGHSALVQAADDAEAWWMHETGTGHGEALDALEALWMAVCLFETPQAKPVLVHGVRRLQEPTVHEWELACYELGKVLKWADKARKLVQSTADVGNEPARDRVLAALTVVDGQARWLTTLCKGT